MNRQLQEQAGISTTVKPALRFWDSFRPQFRNWHFWIVQGLVVCISGIHILTEAGVLPILEIPYVMPTGLLLVTVVYAALTFGLGGALPTALWVGVFTIPNAILWHDGLERTGELSQLGLLVAVAFFVGRQVDRRRITQRQLEASSAELKSSRMRYRSLFESSPVAVLVLDLLGTILEANPTATTLFRREQTVWDGLTIADLLGDANSKKLLEHDPDTGQVPEIMAVTLSNGSELYLEPLLTKFNDGRGNFLVEVIFRDVTEEHGRRAGLKAYTTHVVSAQEEERRRIAREIHDGPIQSVVLLSRRLDLIREAGAALPSEVAGPLEQAAETSRDILEGLRNFLNDIRPSVLDDLGLTTSLRKLLGEFTDRTRVKGSFKVVGDDLRLPMDAELGLYRIAHEAFRNVEHHAAATRVSLSVALTTSEAKLEVSDNGVGFAITSIPAGFTANGHLGLISMQERAESLGGKLDIQSGPGKGTRVRAWIPITRDAS